MTTYFVFSSAPNCPQTVQGVFRDFSLAKAYCGGSGYKTIRKITGWDFGPLPTYSETIACLDEGQNDLYELYGLRNEDEPGCWDRQGSIWQTRELIAIFHSEKLAKEYVKKSELKNPHRSVYRYRSSSLLRYYDDFEIVLHIPEVECPQNTIPYYKRDKE